MILENKAIGVMKPGHTFTIEPMICEGSWRDEHWPDNWTAVTVDGKRSAQFEHTVRVAFLLFFLPPTCWNPSLIAGVEV